MDVLRRVRALRRRPEKLVEDSLSADCGALHVHHPAFFANEAGHQKVQHARQQQQQQQQQHKQQQQQQQQQQLPPHHRLPPLPRGVKGARLISLEDLYALQAGHIGLSLGPPAPAPAPQTIAPAQHHSSHADEDEEKDNGEVSSLSSVEIGLNLLKWARGSSSSSKGKTVTPIPEDSEEPCTSESLSSSDAGSSSQQQQQRRLKWSRPQFKVGMSPLRVGVEFQYPSGTPGHAAKKASKKANEVFRSNSFRFERYDDSSVSLAAASPVASHADGDSHGMATTNSAGGALGEQRKVVMSDVYNSPKDLVNRLPLVDESPQSSLNRHLGISRSGSQVSYPASGLLPAHSGSSESSSFLSGRQPSLTSSTSSRPELLLELQYSDPRDSKLYTEPGADPEGEDLIYKLYVGGEYYYCRPYRPDYYAARRQNYSANALGRRATGFSGLPESAVDAASVYEDVNNDTNNNHQKQPPNDCITIISVTPSSLTARGGSRGGAGGFQSQMSSPSPAPSAEGGATTTIGSETGSSDRGSFTINSITRSHGPKCNCGHTPRAYRGQSKDEPLYENLDFHRVKISVPGSNKPVLLHNAGAAVNGSGGGGSGCGSKLVRRRRVVKASGRPPRPEGSLSMASAAAKKRFEKFGYSRNEVWNWLYTEDDDDDEGESVTTCPEDADEHDEEEEEEEQRLRDLYSVPQKVSSNGELLTRRGGEERVSIRVKSEKPAPVEVQFTTNEFLDSSTRLAHLDLDGLEHFVGNTLEKAIARKRKQRNEALRKQRSQQQNEDHHHHQQQQEIEHDQEMKTVTITEVPETSPLNVKCDTNSAADSSHHAPRCQTCLASGESSCSSALSSLESVRSGSGGLRSNTSSSGSETLGSELPAPGHNSVSTAPVKPLRGATASERWRVRMSVGSPDESHLPQSNGNASFTTKAYQTLEVGASDYYMDNQNGLYDGCPGVPSLPHCGPGNQHGSLSSNDYETGSNRYIPMHMTRQQAQPIMIDPTIPLDRQEWYHGSITRVEAETVLRMHSEGSYLVRNSESSRQDFSLSVKSSRGFMHMRIQRKVMPPSVGQPHGAEQFILGQFSKPFSTVPAMIHHYTLHRLPIRGAEHMCLLKPICEQLL